MKPIKNIFLTAALVTFSTITAAAAGTISGSVKTTEGKPLQGVYVSDGAAIVKTDAKGRYKIKSQKKDGTVFVITPSGYIAPTKDGFQPNFWALLDKESSKSETHNFTLQAEDQTNCTILFPTDEHIVNEDWRDDLYKFETTALPAIKQMTANYEKEGPVYMMSLGDISHDVFWYANDMRLDKVISYLTELGFPHNVYSVSGNHDNDGAINGENVDERAAWLYRKTLGPAAYSVNIGNTHWVMLDNIIYKNLPTNKPLAKGITGDRSYDIGFTKEQFEWMKADIALVPDSMEVFIACHAPVLFNRGKGTLLTDFSQIDTLNDIYSRFEHVTIVSGHAHRNLYQRNPNYPRFTQYVFVATSGNIWNAQPGSQVLGADGSDSGLWYAKVGKGKTTEIAFQSYWDDSNNMFRAYDLNTVGRYYRLDNVMEHQRKVYPNHINYSDEKYANSILVNFWGDREDYTLEMLQNGTPLTVSKVEDGEDPLYDISVTAPASIKAAKFGQQDKGVKGINIHMYIATASDATSPIEVRVRDNKGNIICSETVIRPKAFGRFAR